MKASNEESLLTELRRIGGRLGDVMIEMEQNPNRSDGKIADIRTDLDELHTRIDGHAAAET